MAILSTQHKWKVGSAATAGVVSIVVGTILAAKASAAAGIAFVALGAALLLASFGYLVLQSNLARNACERIDSELSPHWQNLMGNFPQAEKITKEVLEQTICNPTNRYGRIFIPAINQIFREAGLSFRFPRPIHSRTPLNSQEQQILRDLNFAPWQRNRASRPQPNVPDQIKEAVWRSVYRLIQAEEDPDFSMLSCFREETLALFLSQLDLVLNDRAWEDLHDQIIPIQRRINSILEQNHLAPRYLLADVRPQDAENSDDDEAEGPALVASMKEENPLRYQLEDLDDSDE